MTNLSDDPNWAPHLLWPDGVPEPTDSLLNMLDEHEPHAEGGQGDGEAAGPTSRCRRAREEQSDDANELEPCSKMFAAGHPEGRAAKDLKANREKQRRAQLNNRCETL